MNNSSLHKQLLITIIVLMLFVSSAIVWVSIQAGTEAVNNLTQRVMSNLIERINSDNEKRLNEAMTTLETVAPTSANNAALTPFDSNFKHLEQRLWTASGLYAQAGNVYFAGADGSFMGVNRFNNEHVNVFIKNRNQPLRDQYAAAQQGDRSHLTKSIEYEARNRPWYLDAVKYNAPVWTEIYTNYPIPMPIITLAKAVYQPDHSLAGVVATDIPLNTLSDNLQALNLSPNSVAFIIDAHGDMVATSGKELSVVESNHEQRRVAAQDTPNKLIQQAYIKVIKAKMGRINMPFSSSDSFTLENDKYDVAYAAMDNKFGLKWVIVVAVPRADFMQGINHSIIQSIVIVVVFIILALLVGLGFIEHILRDIRQLTTAAQKIGNGEPLPRLRIHRKDEIGHLITTFIAMENKLRFDRLTQIHNREFLIAQIEFLERHALEHPDEKVSFTLLFLDLDKFKHINDTYGHQAGDQLLIVIAARLKSAVRETDTVARFGGDEFVVLLNGTKNTPDIQMTINKIHAIVGQPIALADHVVSVNASIGWAVFPKDASNYASLVKIADSRMFSSKRDHHAGHLRLVE